MIETLAALLFAHALADFVLQTDWMIAHKRQTPGMAAHIGTVMVTAIAATGNFGWAIVILVAVHLAFDLIKTQSGKTGLLAFLLDQAAHLASLIAVAALFPGLWAAGLWGPHLWLAPVMAVGAGLILVTRAGGFAVGMLMEPWASSSPEGLPGGGRMIGTLERGLIFVLILSGQAGSIGFLIAAKSVLRFGTVSDDRKVSEYVIIGTLASFGWAMAITFLTVVMLSQLTPLGIPDLTP